MVKTRTNQIIPKEYIIKMIMDQVNNSLVHEMVDEIEWTTKGLKVWTVEKNSLPGSLVKQETPTNFGIPVRKFDQT